MIGVNNALAAMRAAGIAQEHIEAVAAVAQQRTELRDVLRVVRMSRGWHWLADETQALIRDVLERVEA